MPDRPVYVSETEALFIKRFFDGVDSAVATELTATEVAYEEFLTPTLGRLLDGRSPFQSLLEYSLSDLNRDLANCGASRRATIEFQTNEHAKGFSGRVSHADLGIVLTLDDPLEATTVKKAILVEAKRLFPVRNGYSIQSGYNSFDRRQLSALVEMAGTLGWNALYYFFYNPQLAAFDEASQSVIRLVEAELVNSHSYGPAWFGRYDPEEWYYMWRKYGMPVPAFATRSTSRDPQEIIRLETEVLSRRPGVRVMSVSSIHQAVQPKKGSSHRTPSIRDLYSYARGSNWIGTSGAVPFPTLSAFIVDFLMACMRGTTHDTVVAIAEGKAVPMPPKAGTDEPASTLLARHTLRIALQSQLPEGARGMFSREQ